MDKKTYGPFEDPNWPQQLISQVAEDTEWWAKWRKGTINLPPVDTGLPEESTDWENYGGLPELPEDLVLPSLEEILNAPDRMLEVTPGRGFTVPDLPQDMRIPWDVQKEQKEQKEEEDTNPKKAWGALKAPMNACPPTAMIELHAVMGGGAHKYGLYNFRDTKIDAMTYIGAIRRHFMLWEDGVDTDEESGRSHLAHIMACCALALDAHHTGQLVDNRSKTGLVAGLLKDCADTHNKFTEAHDAKQDI